MNTFNLNLDLDKRGGVAQWVTLRQGDRRGTELRATIYDHGTQAGGGYTCRVSIRLPGEGNEYYRETATYTNGVAVVTVDEEYAAAIVGVTEGYFELLQGDAVIASTESFGVRILRSAQDGAVPGDKYDSAIEDALAELDEATGRISQMVVDATEEYLEAHPELTTTVEDNSLTDAKLIQHGGILDRVARLWHRLDNLLTATPAEADALTVTDAAKTPLAGLALYGRSTQAGTPTPSAPVAIESVVPNLFAAPVNAAVTGNQPSYNVNLGGGGTVVFAEVEPSTTYTARTFGGNKFRLFTSEVDPSGGGTGLALTARANVDNPAVGYSYTFTTDASERYVTLVLNTSTGGYHADTQATLLVGSVKLPFAAYGGVSLWARGANLSPLFSVTPISSDGGYWTGVSSYWTPTSDGWARFTRSVTSATNSDVAVYPQVGFEVGQTYTVLLEWRNVTLTGTATMYMQDDPTRQLDTIESTVITAGSGSSIRTTTCLHSADETGITRFLYWRTRLQPDSSLDGEFRLSIYKGEYAGGYQPYVESTTPIPLQGHALRSLPDGTRDEVTVDEYGHAVLTQRVGEWDVSATASSASWAKSGSAINGYYLNNGNFTNMKSYQGGAIVCNVATAASSVNEYFNTLNSCWSDGSVNLNLDPNVVGSTLADFKTWLATAGVTIVAKLATPQTIDLGTIDPIALQGPDMTAQAVPTAPFALTYERDLNVTLARLEAAIADAATA